MTYTIRKTIFSDIGHLGEIERSASVIFKSISDLEWIADADVISEQEHRRFANSGLSWVALETESLAILGFILTEITNGDLYIAEISVSQAHQQKSIGSKLIHVALKEAMALGLNSATLTTCLLYTSPSPRDATLSRMPSSA